MMKCTKCHEGALVPSYLDDLFPSYQCNSCEGSFIFLAAYLRWLESYQGDIDDMNWHYSGELSDTKQALICPKTGDIMRKYKISKDTEHRLDISVSINAIWLDKGEWELLKSEGLADKLNAIFTDGWQTKIRRASTEDALRAMYENRFNENYEAIKTFRHLIDTMPNKSEVIAYLLSSDPYKV